MRLKKVIIYVCLSITAAGYLKTVSASTNGLNVFFAKLQKVFENQQTIDAKLKDIETIIKQIRIRVYRKTGFYR